MDQNKLWNKDYIVYIIINTFNNCSSFLMMAALSLYTKQELGWSASMIGIFAGIFSIMSLISRPFSGLMSDRVSLKKLIVWGNLAKAVTIALYGATRSMELLMVVRALQGVAMAVSGTAITAAAIGYIPRERMNEGIGYFGLAIIIAQSIAPGIGLSIAKSMGYTAVFFISSGFAVFATILMVFMKDPPQTIIPKEQRHKLRMSDIIAKECIPYSMVGGLLLATNAIFNTYLVLSVTAAGLSSTQIAPFYWVNGVALVIARVISGKIGDKKGVATIMYPSFILCFICTAMMMKANTLTVICIIGVIKGFGTGIGLPAIQAAATRKLPHERRGVASGTYYFVNDAGNGITPIIAGRAVDMNGGAEQGYSPAYICNLVFIVLGTALFFVYTKFFEKKLDIKYALQAKAREEKAKKE